MFSHELFKYFNCEQSSRLHRRSKEILLDKGESLFLQANRGEYVFFVNTGTVKIIKTSINGAEKIFSIYQDNQFVALSILFNPPHYYPASGIAVEKTRVTAIPIAVLENAIVSSELATRAWFNQLNRRLENIQEHLTDQVFTDAKERFKKLVSVFATTHGRKSREVVIIQIPITKQEMADLLSIRRETFSRMLAVLKTSGLCTFEGGQLVVNTNWLEEK